METPNPSSLLPETQEQLKQLGQDMKGGGAIFYNGEIIGHSVDPNMPLDDPRFPKGYIVFTLNQ